MKKKVAEPQYTVHSEIFKRQNSNFDFILRFRSSVVSVQFKYRFSVRGGLEGDRLGRFLMSKNTFKVRLTILT